MNNFSNTIPKLVSVIIPCFNDADYLRDAVESVFNQEYQNWECIISDDGSTDNTSNVAFELTRLDNRIKYVKKENGGLASARNFGILNAIGQYILPLDADDKIDRTYLKKTVAILDQDPQIKLVFTDARQFGASNDELIFQSFTLQDLCYSNRLHCTALFRKLDYRNTNGYRENMKYGYEDWDFWMQLLSKNNQIYHLREMLFWVRVKPNSMHIQLANNIKRESLMREQLKLNNPAFYKTHLQKNNLFREVLMMAKKAISNI